MTSGLRWTPEQLQAFEKRTAVPASKKPNKMRNREMVVDGKTFDSEKEGKYWQDLKLRHAAGEVRGVRRQYPIGVTVNGEHICSLIVDFKFEDIKTGVVHYVDVKGRKAGVQYALFLLKKKLVRAVMAIEVEEV